MVRTIILRTFAVEAKQLEVFSEFRSRGWAGCDILVVASKDLSCFIRLQSSLLHGGGRLLQGETFRRRVVSK